MVASDARGVTIQVTVGAWTLTAPGPDGRVRLNRLDGAHALGEPGRPTLLAFATTLAIPVDARPTARVVGTEGTQSRDGVRLEIAGRPIFLPDGDGRLGLQPAMERQDPIDDGPWPASSIQLAAPFAFRGRRFVQLEVRPFRYDESSQRISSPHTLTVRVDFNRPASSPALVPGGAGRDAQVDAALEGNVLNWEQGQGWRKTPTLERSRPGRTLPGSNAVTGAAVFDETQPEVRVKLAESALYKLSFDNLSTNGYPDGVPVGEVSVHRHEFVEGQSPPYATIEIPCEVQDANANGTFDSGDAVWVYVRNWAERSGASVIQRYWGDAEVVYVTSKPGGAARVAQRPGWNNVTGLTPLGSFPFRRHFERDAAVMMQAVSSEVDTNVGIWQWTAQSLYYNRPDTIRIETNDLDTTHAASITVRWVGRKFETHRMFAGIKNGLNQVTTVVDSVFWYGKSAVAPSDTFPGSVLTEGNTNFFRQWGKPQELPPDPSTNYFCNAGLDWFELEYWRRYNAIQDYVRFNSADTSASGDVQMRVTGFTGDSLRVYDVTNPDQPVRLTVVPPQVAGPAPVAFEIQDVLTRGERRQYVAACQNGANQAQGPKQPPASAYSPVTRRNLWSAVTGDYLLVVPEAFESTVAPLAALRSGQGLTVLQAPIESIYDEFNGGRHSAAALERFAKYAYARWNSRFLMLVGDGTLDPNGVTPGSGKDWIPVLPTPAPVGTQEG
ncbi:MAG TPA: C25 family cysteine peptidase, partial [Methylomirabilota bacterium]|nr:C25 family cysteine peptidase [Methylomirabilota bacterium]